MAPAPAPSFDSLRASIGARVLQPVYILHGKEGYYIDKLIELFEQIIPDEDKDFNQHVFYAPRIDTDTVMATAAQTPMMSERQVVIVKECQELRADQVNKYHKYVANPSPTTVFVLCFRGDEAKGKDLMAAAKKNKAVIFESKPVPEWNIEGEIVRALRDKGLSADAKATSLLAEHVGTDLSRIHNAIDKLAAILPPRAAVTADVISAHIGRSKEYNNFELVDALAAKDAAKVFRIVGAFAANPKANPTVLTTTAIFAYFSDLLIAWYTPDRNSDDALMKALKIRFKTHVRRYRMGLQRYSARQVIEIIHAIRDFDAQIKGNGSRRNEFHLLHELCYHILTAPGKIL